MLRRSKRSGLMLLFLVMILPSSWPALARPAHPGEQIMTTSRAYQFANAMRKLWEDHVTWTRLYLVSAASNLPDLDATTNRLLQNQVDIGNAVKPFFGEIAGNKLTDLLKEHILTAAAVVADAKAGDAAKLQEANKKWYANADAIAGFLSGANPDNWPLEQTKAMMREHLDLTTAEVLAHLHGKWTDDVAAYDKVHAAILQMADMLSSGIIKQFPKRFS